MLVKQGTMTQMEKGLNRGVLQEFKAGEASLGAMVPGLFSESPLRNASVPERKAAEKGGHMKSTKSLQMNLVAAEQAEYEDLVL